MMAVNAIVQLVSFSDQEKEDFQIQNLSSGRIGFNPATAKEKEFEISDEQIKLFTEGIQVADRENRIYQDMVPLCIKIDALTN